MGYKVFILMLVFAGLKPSVSDNDNDGDLRRETPKGDQLSSCLKTEGGPELVVRNSNSEEYQNLNYQWNTRLGEIDPLGYILPKKSKDVQTAIKCGRKLNIKMVAKSGGHSYEKYSFGGQRSVVIDLQKLKSVKIDPNTKTASVGSGILMGPLYWELWNSTSGKFGVPGSSCPTAGISGVTLGGGLGFWSKRYGLMSDNVLEYEFVDAQGQLSVVTEKTNPDLYWALRGGGGGNFGIVTKFKFRIHDVSNFLMTNIELKYDLTMFNKVFKSWQAFNYKTKEKKSFTKFVLTADGIHVRVVDVQMSPIDVSAILQYFPKLTFGSYPTISFMNFIEFARLTAAEVSYPPADMNLKNPADLGSVVRKDNGRHSYRAKSYFSSKLLTDAEIAILRPTMSKVPKNNFIEFDSYGGVINKVPSASTAYVHRNTMYSVQVGILTPATDRIAESWVRNLDAAAIQTLDNGQSYQNYVDAELKYPTYLKRYYGSNLARLVEIKNKVDPDNYFEFDQSIPLTI